MPSDQKRTRLETESIVIGYAMSRLDLRYLASLNLGQWSEAYQQAADALSEPLASFKNLRDEFDPYHENPRAGWWNRELRDSRQRVLDELCEVSDDALMELVRRILLRDETEIVEAIDSLAVVTYRAYNVAERLLTGRRAEEYFMANCHEIVGLTSDQLIDQRNAACGFDFGSITNSSLAIEVKGIKLPSGSIQFTDNEWREASIRKSLYLLVVVGNLVNDPMYKLIVSPHDKLDAACRYQTSISATWQASVSVLEV